MRYRKLDNSGDMVFGGGQADFLRDTPDAVAQAVATRLRLLAGEWFLDTSEGTAWRARVLGERTASTRDPEVKARILGTPGVRTIIEYTSTLDPITRAFSVAVRLDTVYGAATVTETL